MRFQGKIWRDGGLWLAEIPLLDAMTQGRTRKEVFSMVKDLVESLVNRPGFCVTVHPGQEHGFEVTATDTRAIVGLLLRRQRARSGMTLAQVAERLGSTSRNGYARYEQGASQPSLDKLTQLLRAVAPDRHLVLNQSDV